MKTTIFETIYPKPVPPKSDEPNEIFQYIRSKIIWDYRKEGWLEMAKYTANNLKIETNKDNNILCKEIYLCEII